MAPIDHEHHVHKQHARANGDWRLIVLQKAVDAVTYKGRTVILFLVIGMLLGGIFTFTLVEMMGTSSYVDARYEPGQPEEQPTGDQDGLEVFLESSGMSVEQLQKLALAYQLIDTRYIEEVDHAKVIDGAVEGMLGALEDPYSVYMDAEQYGQFSDEVLESQFSGIGAEVSLKDGRVTVVAPIKDSPADRAGVRSMDVILSVNDEPLEGLPLHEAVLKIRGAKGTKANLLIEREGVSEPIKVIVVRDDIDVETVYAKLTEDKIGVIEIRQFAQTTSRRFLEELASLEEQGMKGLILDVRNNPGGMLDAVISMAEPFVRKGEVILQVEDRTGERSQTVSTHGSEGKPYPIVVLVNGGSASASEILAAAIQESGGGTLIGEKTYGKGLVQRTFDSGVGDGSNIKLTIAKWLTPKGNYINEAGIVPNIEAKQPDYYQVAPISKESTLMLGQLNNDIKYMQVMLTGLGYGLDREDGYYSQATAEAVRAFQSAHDLPITGQADAVTAEAIEQALIEKMNDPANDLQMNRALEYVKQQMK